MSDYQSPLGNAITETLLSETVKNLAAEYTEIGIDSVLSDGVLKDIPFVSSLIAITKIGITISDRLLINKLIRFLSTLNDTSPEERQAMIKRLEDDPAFGKKVGEHILELLSRVEGIKKPAMIARVFSAYSKNRIDSKALLRLNRAIEQLPISEIPNIRPFHNRSETTPFHFDFYTGQALTNAGLAEMISGFGGITFKSAELCVVFLKLELDK